MGGAPVSNSARSGLWDELDELCPIDEAAQAPSEAAPEPAPPVLLSRDAVRRNERFAQGIAKSAKIGRRRAFPIIGYIGDNGSGKTLTAVRDTLPSLLSGRPVVSTTPLFDPCAPSSRSLHPLYRPLVSWRDVPTMRNCDLLLDEVQSVANSRLSTSIPPQLLTAFLQLRKQGVVLRWTTTHWARIDTALREVTKAAVICNSMFAAKSAGADGWRPKKVFAVRLVDAASLDGAYTIQVGSDVQTSGVRTLARERYRRRDWWPWLYDSGALVQVLDHVDASGWCMSCGGQRSRPKCNCGPGAHL